MANYHLIINEHEKYAIVNALSYYHEMHNSVFNEESDKEQWRLCYLEDKADLGGTDGVDALATKVAQLF